MKVADLQSFLSSLCKPLSASGGKRISDDLERAIAGLSPLSEMTLTEFELFLKQAAEYHRTGILPVKATKSRKKAATDPEKVQKIAQQVMALYEKATDDSIGYSTIESEIKKLDKQLSAAEAKALAKEVGIPGSPRTKKAALEEIQRKINRRKEGFQRTAF